ncbi:MAG TPA: hypothetical protein VF733_03995 [Candidatus Saccharimonadales bacterium]
MTNPNSGAKVIRAVAEQLHAHDGHVMPIGVVTYLGGNLGRINYGGLGRTVDARYDVYIRGTVNVSTKTRLTHNVHLDFLTLPNIHRVRRAIGQIGLGVTSDDGLDISTRRFEFAEDQGGITVPELVAPLGEWMTAAVLEDQDLIQKNRKSLLGARAVPLCATSEELAPLQEFIDHPENRHYFFRFAHEDAGGIVATHA